VRNRYYDRKIKVLVVCLAGARSLLQPEKKVLVICLAGARSLLRPEKKVLVICLAGARLLLRPEKKFESSVWRVIDQTIMTEQKKG
jgi:hypothetical protein